jgi:hypothetical protein
MLRQPVNYALCKLSPEVQRPRLPIWVDQFVLTVVQPLPVFPHKQTKAGITDFRSLR